MAFESSEDKYQQLFDLVSDALFLIDNETGRLLEVNTAASAMYGYAREELLGLSHTDLSAQPAETRKATLEHRPVVPVRHHRRKDGSVFQVEISARHFNWRGREVHLAAIRDITHRLRAEAALQEAQDRYAALFERSRDCVYVCDFQGRFLDANPAALALLGYAREEIPTLDFSSLLDPGQLPKAMAVAEELRAQGRQQRVLEYTLRTKDGRLVVVETLASTIDHDGKPVAIQGIARDITARREAEALAQKQQMELAHLTRLATVWQMASGLAHELNQPLGAIMMYAGACLELLESPQPPDAAIRDALRSVMKECGRAGDIIKRVRAFIRRQEPRKEPIDVGELVSEAIKLLEMEFRHGGVRVSVGLPQDLPKAMGDRVQVVQVLANLLRNALDATTDPASTGKEVAVTVQADPMNREICIAVSDHGCGMPVAEQARLFEAFHTTKPQGLGMGLAISRAIVEGHGGRLSAAAKPDRGMTFTFTLPLA